MSIEAVHRQNQQNTENLATYTFASCPIGDASATRMVAVAIASRGSGTGVSLSSVTIGGTAATIAQFEGTSDSNSSLSAVAYAIVPTGIIADVILTHTAERLRAGIAVYTIAAADSVIVSFGSDSPGNDISVLLDVPDSGGAIIASALSGISGANLVFVSGVTADFAGAIEVQRTLFGHGNYSVAGTVNVAVNDPDNQGRSVMLAALFSAPSVAVPQTRRRRDLGGYGL